MNKEKLRLRLILLSIYQIISGVFGIAFVFFALSEAMNQLLNLLLILVLTTFFGHSVYSGVLLLKNERVGLKHAKVNQILQSSSFFMFGYAFQYIGGLFVLVGLDLTEYPNL